MYSGQEAIDYLAGEISKEDPGESSHWRKYHSSFKFTGAGFEGLIGFGGSGKPHRGLRLWLHRLLQLRFRQEGAAFQKFASICNLAEEITARQGRAYDLDVLRQALTLSFLHHRISSTFTAKPTCCVIGDGFASMTTLLLASGSAGRVILVNLTKTLLVDLWYLKVWLGEEKYESQVTLVTDAEGLDRALAKPADISGVGHVIAIQASDHALLRRCPVDIALNIVSMQEMDPPVIADYFDDLRSIASKRQVTFYCCNREEKTLPDGVVTRFSEYPWHSGDQVMVDELCPWHQHYYTFKIPPYQPYDGPIRHRLVTFRTSDEQHF
jgi:hypothetical protein